MNSIFEANKIKNLVIGILFVALFISGWFLYKSQNKTIPTPNSSVLEEPQAQQNKIKITTTFYPLYDFAKNVGGNNVEVINLTPAGTEPHDFEPTAKDLTQVYNSKLFIINGNGLDAWAEKIQPELVSKGVVVLKMSDHLNSLEASGEDEHGHEEEEHALDPHFWLNPVNAQKQVELINTALVGIDATNKDEYNKNTEAYIAKLINLDNSFKSGLASCKTNTIATSHNAFNYLASQYGLNTLYILGISPEQEPSAQVLAKVAKEAKEKQIKFIFFETLVSPKLAETIAKEIGAKTLELNPLEGLSDQEIAGGKNYLSAMQDNLTNLKIALECQ